MKVNTGEGFSGLVDKTKSMLMGDKKDIGLEKGLSDCELAIGFSSDPDFGVPAHALGDAVFMGDSESVGEKQISAAAEALLKTDPTKIQLHSVFNPYTHKFDQKFAMAGDAEFDPLAGQVFSPWNISYLSKIWKEPLSYSRAKEIIKTEHTGNNPFAEVFTLFMEEYAGWGAIGQTGNLQNTTTNDVNVMNGMMTLPIINMMGTYTVTLEEQKRGNWGMMGSSPVGRKQAYLNYVMDMMDSILIYYGNEETDTKGLLDINPVRDWPFESVKTLFDSTSNEHRGSTMFDRLAYILNDYLSSSLNKFQNIKIAVSPTAWNMIHTMTYSSNYDSTTAMQIFEKSYLAGKGPSGSNPSIEFIPEPLLEANTAVNPNPFDYMVITCPTIDGGPNKEKQATNFYATTLDKFVFPVIPGMYNHQYKTLRRVAGVVAPIPKAVRAYAGFGVTGDE